MANEAHLIPINPVNEGPCWGAWGAELFFKTREAHKVSRLKKVELDYLTISLSPEGKQEGFSAGSA